MKKIEVVKGCYKFTITITSKNKKIAFTSDMQERALKQLDLLSTKIIESYEYNPAVDTFAYVTWIGVKLSSLNWLNIKIEQLNLENAFEPTKYVIETNDIGGVVLKFKSGEEIIKCDFTRDQAIYMSSRLLHAVTEGMKLLGVQE